MPTSYTTNLRLALPATGELSGTWGNTVNNAITTLLDDAVGGYVAVVVNAADQALTANNGLTDQARQAILSVTNTYGAAVSLYAPPIEKLYVIYNADATYNLTFKVATAANGTTASGGTTVVIPPLKRVIVYVDTFNVVEQMNYVAGDITLAANVILGDASTDTVRVNGYMGVGGAANASFAINAVSSALTGTTNTGVNSQIVGSTSATNEISAYRARPGTAAAVYTVSNTFGLSVFDLAKGAGSTVTNQVGIAIADQTQGTNNYGISSTVSSGANKWNIYASGTAANYFAGNVGIGTSSPAVLLHASKSYVTPTGGISASTVGIFSQNNTASASANVSILSRSSGAAVLQFGNEAIENVASITSSGATPYLSFSIASSNTVAATERMRLDASGNLGIGTSSPATKLQVGDATVAASNKITLGKTTATTESNLPTVYAGSVIAAAVGNDLVLEASSTSGGVAIRTAGSTRAVVDYSGNLGLGVTPSAWSGNGFIDFVGNGFIGNSSSLSSNLATFGHNAYYAGSSVWNYKSTFGAGRYEIQGGAHRFFTAPSGTAGTAITFTQAMTLDASGRLLIGNETAKTTRVAATNILPSLQQAANGISAASSGKFVYENTSASTCGYSLYARARGTEASPTVALSGDRVGAMSFAGYDGTQFTEAARIIAEVDGTPGTNDMPGRLLFFTTPDGSATVSERMRIDSNGYVGIGTAAPTAPLDVSTTSVAVANFVSTSASTSGPRVTLFHDSASPAVNDSIGEIRFNANDSAATTVIYGSIFATAVNVTAGAHSSRLTFQTRVAGASNSSLVLDSDGNAQFTGAVVVYAPAPASISTTATLTNANLQANIINTTGTSYTVTMPLGTTLETLVPWFTTNLGYDFTVINTASGTITMAANTGVTTLGGLTIATGTSAQFRIRRTAANTFIMYRLG